MNENMKKIQETLDKADQLHAAYDMMRKAGNEAGMQSIKMGFESFNEEIKKLDQELPGFGFVYRAIKSAQDSGNETIDISDPIHFITEEELAEAFKAFGIERFTMSSTWSSAIEVAYKFDKAGYKVSGMTQINSIFEDIDGNRLLLPALMFELQK